MSDQMIFKRYELKYSLTRHQMETIKKLMAPYMIADEHGKNTICSLYYDTPDFRMVRRSMEHPIYKEKLRLRSYGVASKDSQIFIELKKKYDKVVYKRRILMPEQTAMSYLSGETTTKDCQIGREIDYCLQMYPMLGPSVLLTYEREAYYAKDDHEFRITFDNNILWRDYDLNLHTGIYGMQLISPDQFLMEIKTAGAFPLWLVEILNENHIYRTSFSKYGTAYTTIYNNKLNGGNYIYA